MKQENSVVVCATKRMLEENEKMREGMRNKGVPFSDVETVEKKCELCEKPCFASLTIMADISNFAKQGKLRWEDVIYMCMPCFLIAQMVRKKLGVEDGGEIMMGKYQKKEIKKLINDLNS